MRMTRPEVTYSYFDKDTTISYVRIKTPLGEFTGIARCHPTDEPSEFRGCLIAEMRANLKYYKAIRRDLSVQVKTLENLVKRLEGFAKYNKDCLEARVVRKTLYEAKDQRNQISCKIQRMKEMIQEQVDGTAEARFKEHVQLLRARAEAREQIHQKNMEKENENS